MKRFFLILLFTLLLLTACQPSKAATLELARASENSVEVIVELARNAEGQVFLAVTFAPLGKGLHLYGKDIPKNGVDGLGRPSLVEIPKDSAIQITGAVVESASAQSLPEAPQELTVYPEGAVTLKLPVTLPAGKDWFDDQVIVTYMACTAYSCRPPVEGKVIPVRVPENEAFN